MNNSSFIPYAGVHFDEKEMTERSLKYYDYLNRRRSVRDFSNQDVPKEIIEQLQNLGYETNEERAPVIGKVDGILVLENGKLEGGADRRGDDAAIGY